VTPTLSDAVAVISWTVLRARIAPFAGLTMTTEGACVSGWVVAGLAQVPAWGVGIVVGLSVKSNESTSRLESAALTPSVWLAKDGVEPKFTFTSGAAPAASMRHQERIGLLICTVFKAGPPSNEIDAVEELPVVRALMKT
jgi:hypothetical protein